MTHDETGYLAKNKKIIFGISRRSQSEPGNSRSKKHKTERNEGNEDSDEPNQM